MKKVLIISCLLISIICTAQEDRNVTITASGTGTSKDEAQQKALRSAIEQAFGAYVSSKTEILNDSLVSDQITSVANGNIQKFDVLNETQLPDGKWNILLKAIVSIDKLTSFVQSKGAKVEIKGGLFAANIKQQIHNEQSENEVVHNMSFILDEVMQTSFDYTIKSGSPQSVDGKNIKWKIPITITAKANLNIDFYANFFIKTLSSIGLDTTEVASYKALNKNITPVKIIYAGHEYIAYLRSSKIVAYIDSSVERWESNIQSYTVKSGIKNISKPYYYYCCGGQLTNHGDFDAASGNIHRFYEAPSVYWKWDRYIHQDYYIYNLLSNGEVGATFNWNDIHTLQEIEQMADYSVVPSHKR